MLGPPHARGLRIHGVLFVIELCVDHLAHWLHLQLIIRGLLKQELWLRPIVYSIQAAAFLKVFSSGVASLPQKLPG
jgi:hypothetical protein